MDDQLKQDLERYMQEYPAKAKVQHYIDQAKRRQLTEKDAYLLDQIRSLLIEARIAQRAIEAQDLDLTCQAFERIIRHSINLQLPDLYSALAGVRGRKGGIASRRPPGPLRAVLEAICAEIGSYDSPTVLNWWSRWQDPDTAEKGVAMQYEIWAEVEAGRYHFELNGPHTFTKLQIQKKLSNIRTSKG